MSLKTTIIDVTADKIADYPQIICYINPKHEFYHLKIDWLKERYKEGLKTKLLYLDGEKKPVGFIEYISGQYSSTTRFLNIMKREYPKQENQIKKHSIPLC